MLAKVGGVLAAVAGGYLLWWAFQIVRAVMILTDESQDKGLLTLAGGLTVVGAGFLWLGWYWFSDPVEPPSPPTPGGPPQV